ncbi:SEC-C metal-binding domain-containing protein [Sporosarcina sp. G11-34]|uniref:SEC-C metal-binding domain-containing protein n=1 Tax=Sporosarcina sp. G11-34 TaxID=2849605 RepID=UPI0022A9AF9B|nr:SEC-C metal-binding domain-containing protein [Sporosarcina sp. G11-34]MCZ2257359.1 SEC-C domain-containing protein [Sporosarcina sp. G11-34]
MVGRNDSCLCGSGKKYKKCCALQNEPTNENLVEEELERVIGSFYESALSSPTDLAEFGSYEREWMSKLSKAMPRGEIEQSVAEYFLFIARRDLWKRYLLKVLNGPIRQVTRKVLEAWQDPMVLFGKVKAVHEDHFIVDEVLGHTTYRMNLEQEMEIEVSQLVFGVVLSDRRHHENGVRYLEGLTFIYDSNGEFTKVVESMAAESGEASSYDFFKVHMLDIYKAIADREITSMEDLVLRELRPDQQKVLKILEEEAIAHGAPPQVLEFIQVIAITYLIKGQASFRKPEIVAAAVFKVACDYDVFDGYAYSQSNIAKLFDVSVSSMMKHVEPLYEVTVELMEEISDDSNEDPQIAYNIGTDPWPTERMNWEMYCKMALQNFKSLEEAQAYMEETINEPFKPKGKKQQAQAIAYDAYEAEEEEERYRLAKKLYALAPENVDALLFQAEMSTIDQVTEQFYQKAIEIGKSEFDAEPEIPWGLVINRPYMRAIFAYGIWLFDDKRFSEAADLFDSLLNINPGDHQGVRYFAVSSFISSENLDKAESIMEDYEEQSSEEAAYLFLDWLLEMELSQGESDIGAIMYEEAEEANPFVDALIDNEMPKLPLPKQLSILPGSIDEAMYIWYLL